MQNNYFIKSMMERISRGDFTYFLDPEEARLLSCMLSKMHLSYQVYKPYKSSEKVIFYVQKKPKVSLYELKAKIPLTHSMILGTLFAHSIKKEMYGDILVTDKAYISILNINDSYILSQIDKIGKYPVTFKKVSFSILESYEVQFEVKKVSTSSLRLDALIASVTHQSRSKIESLLNEKSIIYNYNVIGRGTVLVEEGAIFSIKRVGKFKVEKIEVNKAKIIFSLLKYQ